MLKTTGKMALSMSIAILFIAFSLVNADYPIMSQHYAADPTAVEWNGRIYVYCSNDEENTEDSGYIMDSIVCFSTDDLKNWTDHGVVFDADELSSWYSGTAWAPCIVEKDDTFYLYFGDAYWGVGVVVSDSPTGPFTAPKESLVVQRGVSPGADSSWLFDPTAFIDDDGQPYLYFGGEGADQARVILLDENMYDTVGSAMTISFPDFFEALHMHKYNGMYYLSYADNYSDSTPSSQIAYMTSDSPINDFVYQGVALPQPPTNFGNNNHHTFFTFQEDWYCVYHNRYQANLDGVSTTEHRNICLDRMYYNPDGTIQEIVHTRDGLQQIKPLDPFIRVEGETLAAQSGLNTEVCSEGGMNITSVSDGDWLQVRGVDFSTGAGIFLASVASENNGGSIELYLDSLNGTYIGSVDVPNTSNRQTWMTAYGNIDNVTGEHDLYLKFVGGSGDDLFNLDWWQFQQVNTIEVNSDIDSTTTYQTIEGLGGAVCFYNGWFTAHPNKQEIFDHAFSGLNISMLRLGNWWRGTNGADNATYEIVNAMHSRIGDKPILMTSWSPPAYLKSNGEVANGGTLIQVDGEFDYNGFADYWLNSLQDYANHGIVPTWVGVQNEPDWTADYDSCRFLPTEGLLDGEPTASFNLAQEAVFYKLQENMANPPKLLGPECVGLYGNASALRNYMNNMNPDTFYGVAHHLYGGSTDGTPDGYIQPFTTIKNTTNSLFPGKPKFMTEFGDIGGLVPCANLIHNSLVVEQVSGYNHWCLMWPGEIGLVEIENPWGGGSWVNPKGYWLNESFWSMKHFSYYVQPGFKLVQSGIDDSNVLMSAYISPDEKRLVVVYINRHDDSTAFVNIDTGSFVYDYSTVYQTYGKNHFIDLDAVSDSKVLLPPSSVTTIVFDHIGPIPPSGLSAFAVSDQQVNLHWKGSANSLSYNIRRSAESGGPYDIITSGITIAAFCDTSVAAGQEYYYVVSANTLEGESQNSVETAPLSAYTYLKFDETSGTVAQDFTGNNWDGTLVNGAVFSSGKFSNAVNLDGANDFVTLPSGIVSELTECTIAAWVNLDSIDTWSRIFDFGNDTSNYMFLTPRNGSTNVVRFAISTTGYQSGEQQIDGNAEIPTGVWTHIAVTLGNGVGALYVNGVEVGRNSSMTLNPNSLGITTNNMIGFSQFNQWDPYLDGRIDDFRIYDSAFSSGGISAIYTDPLPEIALPPQNLSAVAVSADWINLTWQASSSTVNYNVKRSQNDSGPYSLIASVSETSFEDKGLSEVETYYYVVSGVNTSGESLDSVQAEATTVDLPPAVPTSLDASVGDSEVSLTWNANPENDIAGYNVYRSLSYSDGYIKLNSSVMTETGYIDESANNFITYYYVVTSIDAGSNESGFSLPLTAMPNDGSLVYLSSLDFEDGLDNWINVTGIDSYDWKLNSGGTMTPTTGPSQGALGSEWYIYLETSPGGANRAGDSAILESSEIGGFKRTLKFFYHMYGLEIGSLYVDVFDGIWHEGIWSSSGQQNSSSEEDYTQASVNLSEFVGPFRIRLRAVAAGSSRGDIAIDNIEVIGGALYGDTNIDGIVDIVDLTDFSSQWLINNYDLDLNSDNKVDMFEFNEMSKNWNSQ